MNQNIIFVIYDSIKNSVFSSQVLHPFLNELNSNQFIQGTLITFENDKITEETLNKIIPKHPKLKTEVFYKKRVLGPFNLILDTYKLIKLFKRINPDSIIARGPFSGLIALIALKILKQNTYIKIQARGLCAEERTFSNKFEKHGIIKKIKEKLIFRYLKTIEKLAFGNIWNVNNINIEVVSSALGKFLEKEYKTNPKIIILAEKDIPEKLPLTQINTWRNQIRKELDIPTHAIVYCYSGSAKPWQCSKESIEFFQKRYKENKNSFLLILTTDIKKFNNEISQYNIDKSNFKVLNVNPQDIYKYLSAADVGLLFRHNDIINWVSRPTKMLEYQSVGLKIEHNNTIQVLESLDQQGSNRSIQ